MMPLLKAEGVRGVTPNLQAVKRGKKARRGQESLEYLKGGLVANTLTRPKRN